MYKKSLSIALASVLCFNTVASAGVVDNMLQNYTPSQSVKITDSEGNTVKSMYYTGGYYFRFSNDAIPEPLWNFSPPEIEAGCNGLNLKGMFMSLLGLDQFGAMLQNAGTSLAWGVAVGLIYSLPGVASVFKMINQWAKDIQKLLAMSCQSGIAIGQAIGEKIGKAYDGSKLDKSLTSLMDSADISKYYQSGKQQKIKDAFGLDGLDFNWDSGFSFSGGSQATTQKKRDALVGPLQDLFADYSVGGAIMQQYLLASPTIEEIKAYNKSKTEAMFFSTMTYDYKSGDGKYDVDTLRESVDNMYDKYNVVNGKESLGNKAFVYGLLYNMVGDLGYDRDMVNGSIKKYGEVFECSSAATTNPSTCTLTKAEADKVLLDGLSDPKFSARTSYVGGIKPVNGKQLKTLILKGYTDDTKELIGQLIAPEFLVIATKEANKTNTNFFVTPTNPVEKKPFLDENFVGTDVSSKCSLYKTLTGKVKETYIQSLNTTGLESQGITCDTLPTVIFNDDLSDYAQVLSKATEKEVSEALSRINLVNTYLTTNAVLDTFASSLIASKTGSIKLYGELGQNVPANSQVSVEDTKDKLAAINNFSKVIKDAKEQLDKDYPDAKQGVIGLNEYFENLNNKIKQRTIQSNPQ